MNMTFKISMLVIATLIASMMAGISPLASALSTNGTSTSQGNMHLDAGIKALQSGDSKGALMHLNQANSTLTGTAQKHLDAGIKALQSGDSKGALMHLQAAQKSQ
jgi:hypothetical protein